MYESVLSNVFYGSWLWWLSVLVWHWKLSSAVLYASGLLIRTRLMLVQHR